MAVIRVPVLAAAAAALVLALSGCSWGPGGGASSTPPATTAQRSASATPSPSASSAVPTAPTPSPTSTSAAPTAEATHPPVAPAPPAPDLATYTFPNGNISFQYPAAWSITEEELSPTLGPDIIWWVRATVHDATGNALAAIGWKMPDCGTGVRIQARTIIDQVELGLPARHGSAVYAFFADTTAVDGGLRYTMAITAGPLTPEDRTSYNGPVGGVPLSDGVLCTEVQFGPAPFASVDSARVWYGGSEAQQLRALFLSFTYQ